MAINTKYLLVGAGTIFGVPAACYGGYCIYDATLPIPTFADKFKEEGNNLTLIDVTNVLSTEKIFTDEDRGKIDTAGCFSRFFTDHLSISQQSETSSTSTSNIRIDDKGDGTDPVGCMLAKFKYTDENDFTFRSEITVKNDKFGGAVGTYNKKSSSSSSSSSTGSLFSGDYDYKQGAYQIFFLEKKVEDDEPSGEIKGGYYLADYSYYTNKTSSPISIKLPGMESSLIEGKADKTYAGIGTTTSTGGEDVFEGVKFSYGSNQAGLGRPVTSGNKFNDSDFKVMGYYSCSSSDDDTSGKGFYKDGVQSVLNNEISKLEDLFTPFKDKKGKGQTHQEYCDYLGLQTTLSGTDQTRLYDLCYNETANNNPSS